MIRVGGLTSSHIAIRISVGKFRNGANSAMYVPEINMAASQYGETGHSRYDLSIDFFFPHPQFERRGLHEVLGRNSP